MASAIQSFKGSDFPSLRDALLALLLAVAVVVPPILLILLLYSAPVGALTEVSGTSTFLGAMLGAQAAIAALTLAVTLFVMQGVSARSDADDRVYTEYVHRSRVRPIFWFSIGAVAITGAVLTTERLVSDNGTIAQSVPGIPNLALVAVCALAINLAAAIALFERAIRLTQPERWQSLRSDVNKRNVREAVRVFVGRAERYATAQAANEADWSVLFPDPSEGSVDQAVRGISDDAQRAMDERRRGELERSLNSIKDFVGYAMDEIEGAGMQWGPPGSSAGWPPLRELGRALYSFRGGVIRSGDQEYIDELLRLDYWLVSTGLRRSCGELFTAGLNGYRWNYQIAIRVGSRDSQEMVRDRFLMNLNFLTFEHKSEELFPFMQEVIKHQGNMLSDALQANGVGDYRWLHGEFGSVLSDILQRWNGDVPDLGWQTVPSDLLLQGYRVTLMGLTGRAVILADSGEIPDATPYLDLARAVYTRPTELADDVAAALEREHDSMFSQWLDWETPYHISGWSGSVSRSQYPLTCFAVMLMELTEDTSPTLDLCGNASRVLDWFVENSERLERFVRDTPSASARQRREFSTEVLQRAVLRDEVAEDLRIIARDLSVDRVGAFKSGVEAAMLKADSLKRLFEQAGTFVSLDPDAADMPEERGFRRLDPKAFFVDAADGDKIGYSPISGEALGRGLCYDAIHLLCEALEGVPWLTGPLDTAESVLHAVDAAVEDLTKSGVAVVLAGGVEKVFFRPRAESVEGYEPSWRLTDTDPLVDAGRYRGSPILRGPVTGERRVYVVDVGTWGSYVRAPFGDGQYLRVDVEPISPKRAQELLQGNPDYFSDQLDDDSKMRKMQTRVEVRVGVLHDFRLIDPTRARIITSDQPLAGADA